MEPEETDAQRVLSYVIQTLAMVNDSINSILDNQETINIEEEDLTN